MRISDVYVPTVPHYQTKLNPAVSWMLVNTLNRDQLQLLHWVRSFGN